MTLLRHNLLLSVRDRRTVVIGVAILLLTVLAAYLSTSEQVQVGIQRDNANAAMREMWVNQGEKHPHSAAHYGNIITRPSGALASFDEGVDRFVGRTIFLEAHRQNDLVYAEAADFGESIRFGVLTPATVLGILLPLALIFVGFDWIEQERNRDTLRLQVLRGVTPMKFVLAKAGALTSIALLLAMPAFALVLYAGYQSGDHLVDALWICAAYSSYLAIVSGVIISVASFTKQASVSLITSLALWFFACIVLPRTLPELARSLEPSPTRMEFTQSVEEGVSKGIDGHNPRDSRFNALKDSVLKAHGVTHVDSLPINWGGVAMDAGEKYTDRVYDQEFTRVEEAFTRQDNFGRIASYFNPYLAIRSLSMGLSGTAPPQIIDFASKAEAYRREFVALMNADMRDGQVKGMAYGDYHQSDSFWASVPAFTFDGDTPEMDTWLLGYAIPLLCWIAVSLFSLWCAGRFILKSLTQA